MKLTELLLGEMDREVERSRRALEQVPDGKYDWKPHEKSMIFGYLVNMVATIPSWLTMGVKRDELDIAPTDGGKMEQKRLETSGELLEALDKSAAEARAALQNTSDEHLMTPWKLLAGGKVVMETPRYEVYSEEFQRVTLTMAKLAGEKNLDGAALAYVDLTLNCVKCHKHVREVRMTRRSGSLGDALSE